MLIQAHGWGRNHGWREISRRPVRAARIVEGDWTISESEVVLELPVQSADKRSGGAVNLYFYSKIKDPALNGEYMVNIRFTKWDAAKIFASSMQGCSFEQMVKLIHDVTTSDDEDE